MKKSCKFCSNKFELWIDNVTFLFDNIDFSKKRRDCYCGISAIISDYGTINIRAISETYETWVEDIEIPINYCPMCGRKLREEVDLID